MLVYTWVVVGLTEEETKTEGKDPLNFSVISDTLAEFFIPIGGKILEHISIIPTSGGFAATWVSIFLNWKLGGELTSSKHIESGWLRRPAGGTDKPVSGSISNKRPLAIPSNKNANIGIQIVNRTKDTVGYSANYVVSE